MRPLSSSRATMRTSFSRVALSWEFTGEETTAPPTIARTVITATQARRLQPVRRGVGFPALGFPHRKASLRHCGSLARSPCQHLPRQLATNASLQARKRAGVTATQPHSGGCQTEPPREGS